MGLCCIKNRALMKDEMESLITLEKYLSVVLYVARKNKLQDPEVAFGECNNFSFAVAQLGRELGFCIDVVCVCTKFKQNIHDCKLGDDSHHCLIKIENTFFDYTMRQFDADSPFPYISEKLPEDCLNLSVITFENYSIGGKYAMQIFDRLVKLKLIY